MSEGSGYRLSGQIFSSIIMLTCVVLVLITLVYIVNKVFDSENNNNGSSKN